MQSPPIIAEGLGAPLFGAYTVPTFKFQPRRETVDWRRLSALDVERVAQDLDVAVLQENIAGVTFCNLDREVCSRCGQPVDPVLLKVLRLAQLTIEYLLHCQDCLSASVAQLEARLQASLGQQERGQQELGRQADELKGVREESRRRRKMIGTLQQLLLQTGAHSYHTCHLCDKTFMNATFLRGHIQRRHAGTADSGKQRKQEQPVEDVLEELRAKLKWTQGELEIQREAEKQRQLQEAEIIHQRETEAKREFDEWKEKERAQLYGEIDKLKHLFWDEFKNVANHNSTLEEKLQKLQSHNVMESNLGSLRDEDSEEQLRQVQKFQALKEKMDLQKAEWKRKMKELQEAHTTQKKELQEENERLQASLSQDQRIATAQAQLQIDILRSRLQEQARLIASQEQMIQTLTRKKAEETPEGPKAVDMEEESSEEELNSRDGQQKILAALRQNPTLLKQFRPVLEETLEEKLESMGIQRAAKGISLQTLKHLESILRTQREQKARRFSEFLSLRKKLIKEATDRVKGRQTDRANEPDEEPPAVLDSSKEQPHCLEAHCPWSVQVDRPRLGSITKPAVGGGRIKRICVSGQRVFIDPQSVRSAHKTADMSLQRLEWQLLFMTDVRRASREHASSVLLTQPGIPLRVPALGRGEAVGSASAIDGLDLASCPHGIGASPGPVGPAASSGGQSAFLPGGSRSEEPGQQGTALNLEEPGRPTWGSVLRALRSRSPQIFPVAREAPPVVPRSRPAEPPRIDPPSRGGIRTGQAPAPTPGPTRKTGPPSAPAVPGFGLSTPPFSSEEDSEERERLVPPQPPRGPSRMGLRPEEDWDWSDTDSSEGLGPGSGAISSGTLVKSMVKNLEKHLETPVKKPAGGVSLFLLPKAGPQKAAAPGRKTQLSDDESDLDISSLEELTQDHREKPKPLTRSKFPEKFGPTAWNISQPRVPGW
ncbi:cilium assembly protein DZIP1L [Suncus etruscus]|uniref:cilium assembly protein DZIP1L n=1 Tax=Suncus etruscus TaxID=109475 RepID=UPI0021103830|nr:cilium assembly protein DZIP1L [Suncus etruscus]